MAQDARDLRATAGVSGSHDVAGAASAWCAGDDEASWASPTVGVAAVDVPVLLCDERRMKRELVAWAKAVASKAVRESMHCC